MYWIGHNVGRNALFLVSSTEMSWSPGWVVGIDSGYWIPLLAHRANAVPPMIYSLEWGDPVELTSNLGASRAYLSIGKEGASPLKETLARHGITHIFVGSQHHMPMFTELAEEPRLRPIYHQDEIWVFEVAR
jgi:hypothetical protein